MRFNKPWFVVSPLAVLCVTVVSGCAVFMESWEWNQKLTVEVVADGEVVSGSAVSHVYWQEADVFDNYGTDYAGEATIVDLGERGILFALMGERTKYIARDTLRDELGEHIYEKLFPKIEQFRGTREVPRERYPLLVTFEDISDPASVKRVDPDDLAASFGPGVSLRKITLTITDEAVTEGEMEKRLEWITWSRDRFLTAGGGENPLKVRHENSAKYVTIARTAFRKEN